MRRIYTFLFFGLITLAVAIAIVKFNDFSDKNKFSNFEQKCKTKRINLANYKQYEFKADYSLTQCMKNGFS